MISNHLCVICTVQTVFYNCFQGNKDFKEKNTKTFLMFVL